MNPGNSIFSDTYPGGSRFATPSGTAISPDSPLEPFFQADGASFHTSRSVATIRGLGYTYAGLEYWRASDEQMRDEATRIVNRLYAPQAAAAPQAGMLSAHRPQTRYFVNMQLDMEQVERPCQVVVSVDGKFAGSMVVMQQPGKGIMKGGFPIDKAVKEAGLARGSRDEAVAKIQSALQVKIIKGDGTAIPLDKVPSFDLELEDITYTPSTSETNLPKFTNPRNHTVSIADLVKGSSS
ncbi:hypothetical protein CDD83_8679 [Cordyceps sp. RAO-2017]|nr:hypothetical protein CDD83_8679 [Cordyceps sp. RAO-2017]